MDTANGGRRAKPVRAILAGDASAPRLEAELHTRQALGQLPEEWSVIGDLEWPGGRYGHVDHVVVGPSGIYVIDTEPWHGAITVYAGHLRHDGHVEDAVVTQLVEAAGAVSLLVQGVPRELIKPVLVAPTGDPINEKIGGVRVVDTATLVPMLEARQHAMSTHQVDQASRKLTEYLHNEQLVRVAAKAGRVEHKRASRPQGRIRRIPVIRLAIAAWFAATLVLAPAVFQEGYDELRELFTRLTNSF